MPAPDARSVHTRRSSRRLTRRNWLLQMGILGAGGLLAAATASPAASSVIAESPSSTAASLPADTVRKAPVLQMRGGTITWSIEQDPVYLSPFGGVPTANMWGKQFIYDSLLEWDKNLNVMPALAESWSTPDDRTWIFNLRKGVKFHNGKELDSEDVKYSFEMQANPPAP